MEGWGGREGEGLSPVVLVWIEATGFGDHRISKLRLKLKILSAIEQLLRSSSVVIQQLPLFQLQR